ncbi:MAG: Uma2 family endonuclease [Elainellaceae cyanobacterium]
MQAPTQLLTYEEYLELPYTGRRTEFIDGRVIELAQPHPNHNDIIEELQFYLKQEFKGSNLVAKREIQVKIPRFGQNNRGRDPDLVVCTREQWKEIKRTSTTSVFGAGNPPLIAVEVLSPGNWRQDMNEKQAEYARAGVPEYWRINPMEGQRWVETMTMGEARMYESIGVFRGGDRIISKVLSELELTAQQVLDV